MITITSPESADAVAANLVRLRIEHTRAVAAMDAAVAAIQKEHQPKIVQLVDRIAGLEKVLSAYCDVHRAELFGEKKSRETPLAVYGFRLTPWRVEPANRKIKWSDVVERLQRLVWGETYLKLVEPKVNKEALISDREKLAADDLARAGIRFAQDDAWFIDPKPESAQQEVAS